MTKAIFQIFMAFTMQLEAIFNTFKIITPALGEFGDDKSFKNFLIIF